METLAKIKTNLKKITCAGNNAVDEKEEFQHADSHLPLADPPEKVAQNIQKQ